MEVEYVLDVPSGHLRVDYGFNRLNGKFALIFSLSPMEAYGTAPKDEPRQPKLAFVCNTPEQAETIAQAFAHGAEALREQEKGIKQ